MTEKEVSVMDYHRRRVYDIITFGLSVTQLILIGLKSVGILAPSEILVPQLAIVFMALMQVLLAATRY